MEAEMEENPLKVRTIVTPQDEKEEEECVIRCI
jgi:hypothetical protein